MTFLTNSILLSHHQYYFGHYMSNLPWHSNRQVSINLVSQRITLISHLQTNISYPQNNFNIHFMLSIMKTCIWRCYWNHYSTSPIMEKNSWEFMVSITSPLQPVSMWDKFFFPYILGLLHTNPKPYPFTNCYIAFHSFMYYMSFFFTTTLNKSQLHSPIYITNIGTYPQHWAHSAHIAYRSVQ